MSKGPEAKVKADCRAWLRAQGAYVFSPVQMSYGAATIDDLVCYNGLFIGLEYKRPDTRPPPTARQEHIMNEILQAGGKAWVIYSLEDLQLVL